MKRITLLVLMLASVLAYGQKPVKPNLNKALKAYQDGKLDEAKEIIDVAATDEKVMKDGKTWYYRGLIYAAIDTTSNTAYKSLAQEPLKTAVESFKKADELVKAGTDYSITNTLPSGITVLTKPQQLEILANYYLGKSIKFLQDGEDYKGSITEGQKAIQIFENNLKVYPNDTLTYYVVGLAAQNAEDYDVAIESFNKFFQKGGKSRDAYVVLYQIYSGPKEDKNKALEIVREAKAKLPNNPDFPKLEIGLLIDLDRVAEAKEGLEAAVKKEPDNKIYHFYLGYVYSKLEKWDDAKKEFNEALRIDSNYFDAQYQLAQIYFIDAYKIKKEMANLGISAADKKKKFELDKVLVEKYKVALPYWEKAEKMNPSDVDVLDKLSNIYTELGDNAKADRVEKRLKELGAE
jgi:tetratricopeptide (TPR) repeat protein